MNPAAQEFVPRKKRSTDAHGAQVGSSLPEQLLLQQQQQTRLRASAPAFVPKMSTFLSAPPPLQHASVATSSVTAPSQSPLHVDPAAGAATDSQPLSGSKVLSLDATPYTPTNAKVSAKFPSTPRSKQLPASEVKPDVQQSEQHEPVEKSKGQSSARITRVDSAPQEGSIGSTSLTDDNSSSHLQQVGVVEDSVENNFSSSSLPTLFEVSVLAKPALPESIRFNTVWALYADDHPTPFGAPLAYDPVLVHLVGDVECFWRLWRYLPPPSSLAPAFTYHWFRRDIKPNWEHARNKNGGTITIVLFDRDKPGQNSKQTLDDAFMTMLMACCGETLAESTTNLNGIMLKVRQNKPTTVQIWTASSDLQKLKALADSLRKLLERVIGVKPLQKLEYFSHQRTQVGGSGSLAGRMKGRPLRLTPDFTL